MFRRELVDPGRVYPSVDGAGHESHAARLRGVSRLGHDRDRSQDLHAGLANRDHVRPRANHFEEPNQMGNIVVETERP